MNVFETKSSCWALLSRRKFWDVLTPWRARIDISMKRVSISKRNWYLFNSNEETFQFNSIRHIKIQQKLIGADIHISMYTGTASIYCITKKDARRIQELLLP